MTSPIDCILHQSPVHLINYGLVLAVLFRSVWQAFVLRGLQATLRAEMVMLLEGTHLAHTMLHPIARTLFKMPADCGLQNLMALRQAAEHYEGLLFVPLRSQIMLTRDLSTLMGLVATCAALVTAGGEFAKHGRPELLVSSVASGTISTCIAAVGCMLSLWNGSRLTHLRLCIASEVEEWLLQPLPVREPSTPDPAPSSGGPAPESQEEISYAI